MKVFTLTTILFFIGFTAIHGQKGRPNPNKPTNNPTFSGSCPFVLSIEDKNPDAVCSELLKTLVAVSDACTDTLAVNYSWSSSVGGVFSTSRTTTFNLPEFIVSTPLTISISATEGTETKTANYTFIVKPRPSRPNLSPIGVILLCNTSPITLTSTSCTGGSTPIWSNGNAGLTTISVPAIGGTYFKVACQKDGCVSDSTSTVSLVAGLSTSPPTVTNRIICEGTTITTGNGLQANIPNCGGGVIGTYTYSGGTVGYDDGFRSTGGVDPAIVVPSTSNIVKKVSVSITWRKQAGGFQNSCATGNTESYPYHNETQFRIKSPSGKIITLINTDTYGGYSNPTITTVFEDGASPINFYSPPVSGTFAPAQPLSAFIDENPSGTWTLLPFDDYWKDPLCVSGFSLTFTQDTQAGTVTWWDAPTGGLLVHTGLEYIPINTTPGIQTYYAQGQCINSCPSTRTAATLTINSRPSAPSATVNIAEVSGIRNICGGEAITLTATGCGIGETVKWSSNYYGANFATGAIHTFTPSFSNSNDVNQTFTAICEGTNLCKSVNSNIISINVKRKPATPTIFGPGTTACINNNVTLTASACSGGGTLGWTDGRSGGSINFLITAPVNIKVACTINGCTSDSSAVYSINPLPKPSIPTVNASQVQALCIGNSITISASGCTGTVKWTGGATGASIIFAPTVTKSYRASCLGTNGCASDSSVALNIVVLPKTKPSISGPSFVCDPTTVTLLASGCSAANETVIWRDQSVGTSLSEQITQTKTFRAVCIRNGYCVSDSSDIFTVQFRPKPTQPTITPPANSTVCQGTNITLTASACLGGTLGWTGGLTGNSIVFSSVGTKSFKVACTINGCVSDSSAVQTITIKPKPGIPTISSSGNIVCEGQNITLTASACTGGTLGWTGGLAGQSIVLSTVGLRSYKVACTINGCTSDSSLVNAIQIKPKPTQPTITPPANSTVCQGNNITLTASACLGGTLGWTGGLTGNSIVFSSVGTKSFKVACTINGCVSDSSAVQTITIKPKPGIPTISSSGNIVCEGQNITLTASACTGGTLGWTGGLAGQSIVLSTVGLRSYKVACTINGCTSDSSLVNAIQIKPKPTQPTITPPANSTVCQGTNITLTASACLGGTLGWTGGLTGNSIVVSSVGTKSFKVACTINGCTSDSSAVQTITINPKPIFTITNSKPEICEGESSTLTVNGCTGTISWSNGAGNVASINVSPTIATNYIATCTLGSCSSTQQTTITPLQTPRVTASGPLVCDQSITLTAENYPVGATIQWRKDGVEIVGATGTTLVVNETGNYDFVVDPEFTNLHSAVYNYGNSGIRYFNSNLGYFFHGTFFSKTIDGGNTWNDYNTGFLITKMYFIDANTGWLACDSKILKTIDGGNTWQSSTTNFQNKLFLNITFKNNLIGVATTDSNIAYYTNDGGITWNTNNIEIISKQNFNTISDISYIPNTNSLIVTANSFTGFGKIILSLDGGTTWSINSNNFQQLFAIKFNTNYQAIIGSNDGIYKTIDGGTNWTLTQLPTNDNSPIISIDFVDNNIGYAFQEIRSVFNGKIYKTKDGGNTWKLFRSVFEEDNYLVSFGTSLDFISEDKGWYLFNAITNPQSSSIIKKISTPQCPTTPAIVAPPTNQASAITLSADKTEICSGESSTITTSACNGTLSWSNGAGNVNSITVAPTITTNYTVTCTSGACTKTAQITITPLLTPKVTASGPLVCGQSITLTAENFNQFSSGLQWRKNGVIIPGATNFMLSVNEPGNYDFVVGKAISTQLNLNFGTGTSKMKFLNSNLGFFYSGTIIKKTIDGGNTWTDYDTGILLQDIYFNDTNHGWVVGYAGILKTIDGGLNWSLYNNNIGATQFTKIAFKNNLVGIAVSEFNIIYLTNDGGLTWNTNNIQIASRQTFETIGDVKFIPNSNTVIATVNNSVGSSGQIFKSFDNGINWVYMPNFAQLNAIHFQDSNNGWIGSIKSVYKTIDGGINWSLFNINTNQIGIIKSIDFIDINIGYAFMSNGLGSSIIFKTTNSGSNWNLFKSLAADDFIIDTQNVSLDFISDDNGWYTYSGGYNTLLGQYPNKIILNKISSPQCPTTAAIVSPIPRPSGALVINTFKSGAWTDASTWNCGFIPSSLDEVIINSGHTITDSGNLIQAKKVTFNGNGTLQIAPNTNLRLGN